jgi:hypothetical protein
VLDTRPERVPLLDLTSGYVPYASDVYFIPRSVRPFASMITKSRNPVPFLRRPSEVVRCRSREAHRGAVPIRADTTWVGNGPVMEMLASWLVLSRQLGG